MERDVGHDEPREGNGYDAELVALMKQQVTNEAHVRVFNTIRKLFAMAMNSCSYSYKGGCEVFCGAHVILEDGAHYYEEWRQVLGATKRWSSHYDGGKNPGTVDQYEIAFPKGWGALLFGKYQTTADGGKTWTTQNKTWFQMEEYPAKGGVAATVGHVGGWVTLKASGKNSGPKGKSKHTEKKEPARVDGGDASTIVKKESS